MVPGSTKVDVGEAIITGQTVSFPVQATAEQIAVLDPSELKAMVLGKRIDEARAILAPFGQVALSVSPDWTGSVPSFDSRVTLTIDRAVPIETPGGSAPASTHPSRRRRRPAQRRARPRDAAPGDRPRRTPHRTCPRRRRRVGRATAVDRCVAGATWMPTSKALATVVEAQGIDALVVGLPLEASGDEGPMAVQTRAWGDAIRERLDLPLSFRDERLSSHLAEARLGPMKRGRSGGPPSKTQRDAYRARVDREAAAIILQDELDTRAGARSSMPRPQDPQESNR